MMRTQQQQVPLPEGGHRTTPPTVEVQQQQQMLRPRDLRSSLAQFSLSMFTESPSSMATATAQEQQFPAVPLPSNNNNAEDDDVCFDENMVGSGSVESPTGWNHQQQQQQRQQHEDDDDTVMLEDHGVVENQVAATTTTPSPAPVFEIPILPQGRIVVVRVLSSWGSTRCVGLSGIEFFDETGEQLIVPETNAIGIQQKQQQHTNNKQSSPSSSSITAAAEALFPVANVVREPFDSTDEGKMWLQVLPSSSSQSTAAATTGVIASFAVVLPGKTARRLAAMRLWNYNGGGRAHVDRGARLVEVFLDETRIFAGEIRCSTGDHRNADGVETIIFTKEIAALTRIAEIVEMREKRWESLPQPGSATSCAVRANKQQGSSSNNFAASSPTTSTRIPISTRPANGASGPAAAVVDVRRSFSIAPSASIAGLPAALLQAQTQKQQAPPAAATITVRDSIQLVIASSWDEESLVGLSALQFIDENGDEIQNDTTTAQVTVECSEGWGAGDACCYSYCVPELVDGNPNTRWLHQVEQQLPVILTVRFARRPQRLSAMRIANFAGSDDGRLPTTMGVKHLRILVDGCELDGQDTKALMSLQQNNSNTDENCNSAQQQQWLVARKAPAGSHRMSQLLFQTWTAASLSNVASVASSSSSNVLLSASVTTAARVAILRANYASAGVARWPLWAQQIVDTDVPYLPCAYTFSLSVRSRFALAAGDSSPESLGCGTAAAGSETTATPLLLSGLTLLDEEGIPLQQDFFCWEPDDASEQQQQSSSSSSSFIVSGDGETATTVHVAFETVRCMSLMCFDVKSLAAKNNGNNNGSKPIQFEVTVLANDTPIYGRVVTVAATTAGGSYRHVVPFCPDERILSQFKSQFLAMVAV